MKINSIYIKNLNSLAGEFHVDFNAFPLKDAGLFAITGPTGSGKTTLLDAITLALYGRSPRFDKVTKTQVGQEGAILTKGANEAIAEIEFEVHDQQYRAHWSIAINRNGNLNHYHHELISLPDQINLSDKKGATEKKAEEITGLTFEQFTRTVLLAQGAFARLLEAGREERFQLLQQITGIDFYRNISIFLYHHNKKLEALENELTQKIGLTDFLSEEVVNALKARIEELTLQLQTADTALKDLKTILQLKLRIQEEKVRTDALQLQQESLHQQWLNLEPRRAKWSLHQKALPLYPDFLNYQNANTELLKLHTLQATLDKELREILQSLDSLQSDYCAQLNIPADADDVQEQIFAQLNALAELHLQKQALSTKLVDRQKAMQDAVSVQNQKQDQLNQFLEKSESLQQRIHKGTEWLEAKQVWSTVKDQLSGWEQQVNTLKETQDAISTQAIKLGCKKTETNLGDWIQKELDTRLTQSGKLQALTEGADPQVIQAECDRLLEFSSQLKEAHALAVRYHHLISEARILSEDTQHKQELLQSQTLKLQQLEADIQSSEKALLELQKQKDKLTEAEKLQQVRDALQAGDPCPVCGSEVHPGITHYLNTLHQHALALEALTHKLKQQQKDLSDTQISALHLQDSLKRNQASIEKCNADTSALKQAFTNLALQLPLEDADAIQSAEAQNQARYQQAKTIRDACTELKTVSHTVEQLQAIQTDFQKAQDKEYILWKEFSPFIAKTDSLSLKDALAFLKKESKTFHTAQDEVEKLKLELTALQSATSELQTHLSEIHARNVILQTELNTLIAESGELQKQIDIYPPIPEPLKVLQTLTRTFAQAKEAINQKQKAISDTQASLTQARQVAESANLQWQQLMQNHGFTSEADFVQAYIRDAKDAESLKQEITRLEDQKKEIDTRFRDANLNYQTLIKQDIHPTNAEELKGQILTLENQITEWLEARQEVKSKIQNNEEKLSQMQTWLEQLNTLKAQHQPWYELGELIQVDSQGKNFNEFAQMLTLKVLLMQANANLLHMQDRYRLDMADENLNESPDSLYVIDAYMGNTRRAADKTLSGGEKFIASLALALGLSDLSAGRIQLANLFIDEGFGSLDPDTLDKAIGILESLQQERSRTIGIISHVSELKERISVQIQMIPGPNGHSTLQFQPLIIA